MKSLLFFVHLCMISVCVGQLDSSKVTDEYVYEFDMKYVGSNFRVDPNYQYVLDYLIELMQKNENYHLHIRGHVCCGPNERLSTKRAKKVFNYLKRAGLPITRMSFKGYSNTKPINILEETEEDEQQNRRVDFIITVTKK